MIKLADCAEIRHELGVYILGAASPADRARVGRHLASCRSCREEVAGLAALPGLLRKLPADEAEQLVADVAADHDPGSFTALQDRLISQLARRRRRTRWLTAAAAAALAAAAGTGWALRPGAAQPEHAAFATILETRQIGGATVLTDAEGYTVYWFARDTATTSTCTGSCARYWPPVTGPAAAGPGVSGQLGTITRPDGTIQATYDGHPLYTASADTAPGQARGNDLNSSGGTWHEVTVPAQG
jgi:predicted lipoprotein with Yx(FWY)xxD motif